MSHGGLCMGAHCGRAGSRVLLGAVSAPLWDQTVLGTALPGGLWCISPHFGGSGEGGPGAGRQKGRSAH
eukprot:6933695-Pyramimonas_sp.AAC.1